MVYDLFSLFWTIFFLFKYSFELLWFLNAWIDSLLFVDVIIESDNFIQALGTFFGDPIQMATIKREIRRDLLQQLIENNHQLEVFTNSAKWFVGPQNRGKQTAGYKLIRVPVIRDNDFNWTIKFFVVYSNEILLKPIFNIIIKGKCSLMWRHVTEISKCTTIRIQ